MLVYKLYHKLNFNPLLRGAKEYLLYESVVLSFLLLIITTIFTGFFASLFISAIPVVSMLFLAYNMGYEQKTSKYGFVVVQNIRTYIFLFVSLLPFILISSIISTYSGIVIWSIGISIILVYFSILLNRRRIITKERSFFIPKHHSNTEKWEYASILFERGVAHYDNENMLRAYHWLSTAKNEYEELSTIGSISRFKRISKEFTKAAGVLIQSIETKKPNTFSEYQRHLDLAAMYINNAICDGCGRQVSIEKIHTIVNSNGVLKKEYCGRCYFQYQNSTGQEWEKNTQKATGWSKKREKTDNNQTERPNTERDEMSIKEAAEIFSIEPPFSEDKIKTAFREKAKESHPDTNGSINEFKKVKEARDVLKEANE